MFDSNDEILVSVYKNSERIYLLKTKFRKVLFAIFISLLILVLGVNFFFLYLFQSNKSQQVYYASSSINKPTIGISGLELKKTEEDTLDVFFKIKYKEDLHLRVLVFAKNSNRIITQKPIFNLSDIFTGNTCDQGDEVNLTQDSIKNLNFSIPYEGLDSFESLGIFICDKNDKISNFYREINISSWSNQHDVQ